MSAVVCKERFLHENEIVQYLQNCKFKDVGQGHSRKPCLKTAHASFTKRSILRYFLRLYYAYKFEAFVPIQYNMSAFSIFSKICQKCILLADFF